MQCYEKAWAGNKPLRALLAAMMKSNVIWLQECSSPRGHEWEELTRFNRITGSIGFSLLFAGRLGYHKMAPTAAPFFSSHLALVVCCSSFFTSTLLAHHYHRRRSHICDNGFTIYRAPPSLSPPPTLMCDIPQQEQMGDLWGNTGRIPWQSWHESWWSKDTKTDTSGLQGSGAAADVWHSATCEYEKSHLIIQCSAYRQMYSELISLYFFIAFQSKGNPESPNWEVTLEQNPMPKP